VELIRQSGESLADGIAILELHGFNVTAADLGHALGLEDKTVSRHINLTVDLLLVRWLAPLHAIVGKRLVCASGMVHSLLELDAADAVIGHPRSGGRRQLGGLRDRKPYGGGATGLPGLVLSHRRWGRAGSGAGVARSAALGDSGEAQPPPPPGQGLPSGPR
jgi:hypothetical protein